MQHGVQVAEDFLRSIVMLVTCVEERSKVPRYVFDSTFVIMRIYRKHKRVIGSFRREQYLLYHLIGNKSMCKVFALRKTRRSQAEIWIIKVLPYIDSGPID